MTVQQFTNDNNKYICFQYLNPVTRISIYNNIKHQFSHANIRQQTPTEILPGLQGESYSKQANYYSPQRRHKNKLQTYPFVQLT